jgi:hypothetical protein
MKPVFDCSSEYSSSVEDSSGMLLLYEKYVTGSV